MAVLETGMVGADHRAALACLASKTYLDLFAERTDAHMLIVLA